MPTLQFSWEVLGNDLPLPSSSAERNNKGSVAKKSIYENLKVRLSEDRDTNETPLVTKFDCCGTNFAGLVELAF